MTFKPLFSRSLGLAPGRLHFAAHSHHLWPDASFEGQVEAWDEANRYADKKWDRVFGEVVPQAQQHVARELNLSDPETVVFAPNTHDFLLRIFSGFEKAPVKILSTDGEFHAFRRQSERWEEAGQATVHRVPLEPFETFGERFVAAAKGADWDWIVVSQVFFKTGQVFDRMDDLAALARPQGPWVLVDGYHGFMATPTDLKGAETGLFYVTGGYKYAMTGEGAGMLHAPNGFCERPVNTGWFAEFGNLMGPPDGVQYRGDAGRFWGATFESTPLYRFNAVRRMLDREGLTTATIADHSRGLMSMFQQAVLAGEAGALAQAELINPIEGAGSRARFLAFRHPNAQAWRKALLDADVITDVRADTIRFGFGVYQDETDLADLTRRCAKALA